MLTWQCLKGIASTILVANICQLAKSTKYNWGRCESQLFAGKESVKDNLFLEATPEVSIIRMPWTKSQ